MTAVFEIVLPMFAIILLGYLAARWKVMGSEGIQGLNSFVYNFALPAFLFFLLARSPILELFDWRVVITYTAASTGVFLAGLVLVLILFRKPLTEAAVMGGTSAFSNLGYLGVPLCVQAFGPEAGVPAGIVMMMDNLVIISAMMMMIEAGAAGQVRVFQLIRQVGIGILRNPFMIGMLAGVAWSLLDLPLPAPVDRFGTLLGGAAGPCALFTLGATLYGRPVSDGLGQVGVSTVLKLLAMPALVWLFATKVAHLSDFHTAILMTMAALPTGANIFVVASQYNVAVARASTAVLISTAFAVVTVSILILQLLG